MRRFRHSIPTAPARLRHEAGRLRSRMGWASPASSADRARADSFAAAPMARANHGRNAASPRPGSRRPGKATGGRSSRVRSCENRSTCSSRKLHVPRGSFGSHRALVVSQLSLAKMQSGSLDDDSRRSRAWSERFGTAQSVAECGDREAHGFRMMSSAVVPTHKSRRRDRERRSTVQVFRRLGATRSDDECRRFEDGRRFRRCRLASRRPLASTVCPCPARGEFCRRGSTR